MFADINHKQTHICIEIEINFLNTSEGGCTAPVSYIHIDVYKRQAITPSFRGRIVLISSWVLPCICFALSPTAIGFPVERSIATIEG